MSNITCCYKCDKRSGNCHATCKDYEEQKKINDIKNEQIRKSKAQYAPLITKKRDFR